MIMILYDIIIITTTIIIAMTVSNKLLQLQLKINGLGVYWKK